MSDVFESRPLNLDAARRVDKIKSQLGEILETIYSIPPSNENGRMMALAQTKLEEACFWAVKACSRESTPKHLASDDEGYF
jgi:hypothetical protein